MKTSPQAFLLQFFDTGTRALTTGFYASTKTFVSLQEAHAMGVLEDGIADSTTLYSISAVPEPEPTP